MEFVDLRILFEFELGVCFYLNFSPWYYWDIIDFPKVKCWKSGIEIYEYQLLEEIRIYYLVKNLIMLPYHSYIEKYILLSYSNIMLLKYLKEF